MIITLNLDTIITDRYGKAMKGPTDGDLKLSDVLYEAVMAPVAPKEFQAAELHNRTELSDRVTAKGEQEFDVSTVDRIETMCEKRWESQNMQVLKRVYEVFKAARAAVKEAEPVAKE